MEYFCDADTRCVEKLLDYGPHDCVILLGAERYSRMTCVLAEMAHDAGCRLIVITDKLTAPFAGDADIVLLADLSSPSPTNSYIGVNFLIEAIAFEFSRTLGVYPQQLQLGQVSVRAAAVLTGGQKALHSRIFFVTIKTI